MNKPSHSANPYVRLSYGDIKKQTSVTKKSLLPSWNESFIFPFEEFCNFKMTVYNKVAFGRDEVVGKLMQYEGHPACWPSVCITYYCLCAYMAGLTTHSSSSLLTHSSTQHNTTQHNTIGESYLKMPSSQHPVARWYSLKTRSRTVLDLGRRMVEGRSGSGEDSIGQLFLAALLLDPLELTQIGQGLMELPQGEQSRAHDELTTGRMYKLGP